VEAVQASEARRFGKYTLVAKLATGGMAEIFLARFQGAGGFEKLVCIKRILPQFAKDPQFVGMFMAEAKIAAQISHPNVCQVFELGEIDGRYYIAMEYLAGVPLAVFRRRDIYAPAIDPRLLAGLGVQACEGLHHAHQLTRPDGTPIEVVHRDVSGNNLFATVDGIVKVLDFGIAKIQDTSVRTSTGSVKGTYAYMAPEQLRGERLDRRTDVFALGIVLWELIARRHLFRRETDFLTFQAITQDPIPDPRSIRPDLPPLLADVIARALSRDREQRFPTARALGEALAQAVAPLGGPLPASAISDEIARAFEPRLRDQRMLIQVAREGGQLDLEDDVGPSVGHGTELITTPVSILSNPNLSQLAASPVDFAVPEKVRTHISAPVVTAAPQAPMPGIPSGTFQIQAPSSHWWIPVVVLILVAGAAVMFYMWINHTESHTPAAVAMPTVVASDAASVPVVVIDAAVVEAPADAPVVAVVPPDAAPVHVVPSTAHSDSHPPPPRPSGPPGFITIDSSPVYAVITIDGKNLGETPLVNIALSPGKHVVHAVAPSGATRNVTITIESGKTAPARRIEW